MNRSLFVILGGFGGGDPLRAQVRGERDPSTWLGRRCRLHHEERAEGDHRAGYGMRWAGAACAAQMGDILKKKASR